MISRVVSVSATSESTSRIKSLQARCYVAMPEIVSERRKESYSNEALSSTSVAGIAGNAEGCTESGQWTLEEIGGWPIGFVHQIVLKPSTRRN